MLKKNLTVHFEGNLIFYYLILIQVYRLGSLAQELFELFYSYQYFDTHPSTWLEIFYDIKNVPYLGKLPRDNVFGLSIFELCDKKIFQLSSHCFQTIFPESRLGTYVVYTKV